MNKNATKWVEELRSRKWKQVDGCLSDGKKYCCLGVLCELAILDGVKVKKVKDEDDEVYYDGESGVLPAKVMKWAGLKSDDGGLGGIDIKGQRYYTLVELNDEGIKFGKIADLIEKHQEKLFKKEKKKSV